MINPREIQPRHHLVKRRELQPRGSPRTPYPNPIPPHPCHSPRSHPYPAGCLWWDYANPHRYELTFSELWLQISKITLSIKPSLPIRSLFLSNDDGGTSGLRPSPSHLTEVYGAHGHCSNGFLSGDTGEDLSSTVGLERQCGWMSQMVLYPLLQSDQGKFV